jgi:hypothetical protein
VTPRLAVPDHLEDDVVGRLFGQQPVDVRRVGDGRHGQQGHVLRAQAGEAAGQPEQFARRVEPLVHGQRPGGHVRDLQQLDRVVQDALGVDLLDDRGHERLLQLDPPTPPIVSTIARKELKLNSTKWSSRTPVRSLTVLTAQDGPPMFIAPSMIADWQGPMTPVPIVRRGLAARLVHHGVPRDGQHDGPGVRQVQVDQQEVVGVTGVQAGVGAEIPGPLAVPGLRSEDQDVLRAVHRPVTQALDRHHADVPVQPAVDRVGAQAGHDHGHDGDRGGDAPGLGQPAHRPSSTGCMTTPVPQVSRPPARATAGQGGASGSIMSGLGGMRRIGQALTIRWPDRGGGEPVQSRPEGGC